MFGFQKWFTRKNSFLNFLVYIFNKMYKFSLN